jgi:hypothetical protein
MISGDIALEPLRLDIAPDAEIFISLDGRATKIYSELFTRERLRQTVRHKAPFPES